MQLPSHVGIFCITCVSQIICSHAVWQSPKRENWIWFVKVGHSENRKIFWGLKTVSLFGTPPDWDHVQTLFGPKSYQTHSYIHFIQVNMHKHKWFMASGVTYKRCGTDMMIVKCISRYKHVYFTMGLQHNCGQFTLTMFWNWEHPNT